eukprot:339701-Pelagomonas_calceolata.AAC.1
MEARPAPRGPLLTPLRRILLARAAFLPAEYKKTFTPKFKDWKQITYTDGSIIKRKDDASPPLSGS